MTIGSYKQFCPVAMAAEILCTRWTVVLLRELVAGSTRFNELRRGVPRMSPALLSQRLKELELAGIVTRKSGSERGSFEYRYSVSGQASIPPHRPSPTRQDIESSLCWVVLARYDRFGAGRRFIAS